LVDQYVSVQMTLSDPNPGFTVSVYLQVEYLKKVSLRVKVTIEY